VFLTLYKCVKDVLDKYSTIYRKFLVFFDFIHEKFLGITFLINFVELNLI